jgi:repressor LexA
MSGTLFENEFIRQGILLENEYCDAIRSRHGEAVMQVGEVVQEVLAATGWNQAHLARAIGVSQGNISKWRSGQHSPNKEQWDAVLALIKGDPRLAHLRFEVGTGEAAVMGRVGAGAIIEPEVEQTPPDGLYSVTLPFPVHTDMIGFVVDGDSMYPKYEPGDVIVVYKDQRRDTVAYMGQTAVVLTEDGRRYLKKILSGSKSGLYRLESHNAPLIHDVSITWVGEIYATLPQTQVFKTEAAPKKAAAKRKQTKSL